MDPTLILPSVLQVLGLAVILAEIVIPSAGLLTLAATGLFGYSLYLLFAEVSMTAGLGFLAADLVLIPMLAGFGFKILAKSPVTLRKELSSQQGFMAQADSLEGYIGRDGISLTDLRPSGTASIAGQRLDVVTQGKYLDKNTPVQVVKVAGNQIIVHQKPPGERT